MVRV
ncbi:hypothetical protein E2C01_101751 [Portunus trituberculatus]|jgi:hypothetical protein